MTCSISRSRQEVSHVLLEVYDSCMWPCSSAVMTEGLEAGAAPNCHAG